MKSCFILLRWLSLMFLLGSCAGKVLAHSTFDEFIFINTPDRISVEISPRDVVVSGLPSVQHGAIEFTIHDLAIWTGRTPHGDARSFWGSDQIKSRDRLSSYAQRLALEKIVRYVNKDLDAKLEDSEIHSLVADILPRIDALLAGPDGYKILEPAVLRQRGGGSPQCVVASYYFRFDHEKIQQEFLTTPVVIEFPSPKFDPADISSDAMYVVRYDKHEVVLGDGDQVPKEETQWQALGHEAISELSKEAFGRAIEEANKDRRSPRTAEEIQAIINDTGDLERYTQKYEVKEAAIAGRGKDSKLLLTVYFYFNRLEIKDLVEPVERSEKVKIVLDQVLRTDIPQGDDSTFIAVFRDHEEDVDTAVEDTTYAREKAARIGVEKLKKQAFNQAAEVLRDKLPKMTDEEYKKAIEKADRRFLEFIKSYEWIDEPMAFKRSGNTTAPEGVRLNIYFLVDLDALKKVLLSESLMAEAVKLKTYVELYWNAPKDDLEMFPPDFLEEMTATVIQNVEDQLSRTGYRVTEFEKVKGDLQALMLEAETEEVKDDAGAEDELSRLMLNLKLRNLSQSKFEGGKRLLSEYADLLIGVAFNTIELSGDGRKITIRLTVDATLFERGTTEEWVKLASSDDKQILPFRPGNTNLLIEAGKLLSEKVTSDLLPKIKDKLVSRAVTEDIILEGEQTYVIKFPDVSKDHFRAIKKIIKNGSEWERKAAKTKQRELSYAYEGGIINFEEELRDLLENEDYEVEDISYKTGDNRLVVTFYELEVEQIFIVVFPEVSKSGFKEIRRYIKDEMEEWSRKKSSSKKRELHYAYDGSGEDFESELEELFEDFEFEDEEFDQVDIDYETGSSRIVVTFE